MLKGLSRVPGELHSVKCFFHRKALRLLGVRVERRRRAEADQSWASRSRALSAAALPAKRLASSV